MSLGVTPDLRVVVMSLHLAKDFYCQNFGIGQIRPGSALPQLFAAGYSQTSRIYCQVKRYDIILAIHHLSPSGEEGGESSHGSPIVDLKNLRVAFSDLRQELNAASAQRSIGGHGGSSPARSLLVPSDSGHWRWRLNRCSPQSRDAHLPEIPLKR
jgi:hypothetical protein